MKAVLGRLHERCESILFVDYRRSLDALGLYRIAFAAYYLFIGYVPKFSWIAGHPAAFFHPPPGLPRLLPASPQPWALQTLDLVLFGLFAVLLVGRYTRAVSIGISVLLLVGNSYSYSFGKIDHDILFVLTPLLFAGSWGLAFSLDARGASGRGTEETRSSLALLACLIAFGFFTAGLPKLVAWLDFDLTTHGVKRWVLTAVSLERTDFLVPFFASLETPWIWEALDIAAVVFEIGFVVALFAGPRVFGFWIGLAVLFHLLNYLMLNIAFEKHLALYAAFIDWETVARRARQHLARAGRRWLDARVVWPLGLACLALVLLSRWIRQGDPSSPLGSQLSLSLGPYRLLLVLGGAAVITLALGARLALRWARRRSKIRADRAVAKVASGP